jgi:hypothetical protein
MKYRIQECTPGRWFRVQERFMLFFWVCFDDATYGTLERAKDAVKFYTELDERQKTERKLTWKTVWP